MNRNYIYLGILVLFLAGNVYQALNPRVEIKEKVVEVEKVVTKIKTNVKVVKVTAPDGTVTETTVDLSTTETDSNIFTESKTETKPKPLPLNYVYLGINPTATTDLQLIYGRRVFGNLSAYVSGSANLATMEGKAYLGAGIQF